MFLFGVSTPLLKNGVETRVFLNDKRNLKCSTIYYTFLLLNKIYLSNYLKLHQLPNTFTGKSP